MCYAIPGKLVEIKGLIGIIDYFGEKRNVLIDITDIKIGDYVYAQGGVLIRTVEEKEALEVLDFWKEKFFELKKTDQKLAKVEEIKASKNILKILQKVNLKKELKKEDINILLNTTNKDELKLIYETANNIRQKDHDNACCVHGIIEFSNYCQNDCEYCGIRKSKNLQRYRMEVAEIIDIAKKSIDELGFKAIVLQSGEDPWYTEEKLVKIVSEIRKLGVLIFISIGIRPKETYEKLYAAGARAILLRFETSNKELFKKLRPETDFQERIQLIKDLKKIGYLIATGFLIGLPGETNKDIVNNILLTKELKTDMYSFGPFIPNKNTPLEKEELTKKDQVLKVIAISRFIDRQSKILVTSALEALDSSARKQGLLAGANSLMINTTPTYYRNLYSLYPNRPDKDKEIKNNINETLDLLYSIGRAPTDIGL